MVSEGGSRPLPLTPPWTWVRHLWQVLIIIQLSPRQPWVLGVSPLGFLTSHFGQDSELMGFIWCWLYLGKKSFILWVLLWGVQCLRADGQSSSRIPAHLKTSSCIFLRCWTEITHNNLILFWFTWGSFEISKLVCLHAQLGEKKTYRIRLVWEAYCNCYFEAPKWIDYYFSQRNWLTIIISKDFAFGKILWGFWELSLWHPLFLPVPLTVPTRLSLQFISLSDLSCSNPEVEPLQKTSHTAHPL